MVEFTTGEVQRYAQEQLFTLDAWPIPPDALLVGHYVCAEFKCSLALGWPRHKHTVDTFAESRCQRNGLWGHLGFSLLDCCDYYGHPVRESEQKKAMQKMFASGGPTTPEGWAAGVAYCQEDVEDTLKVFESLLPRLDLPRALIRGRYMHAVACMERVGLPIDVPLLEHLRDRWGDVQSRLVEHFGNGLGCYEGGKFRTRLFKQLLRREGVSWPRLESGKLDLRDKTFRNACKGNKTLSTLRELRHALGQLRLFKDLAVGADGRNRVNLSPFRSKTGRNQPSNSRFVFGTARAIRGLVQAPPGKCFGYFDYKSQEIAVAAVLSKDERLLRAYESDDVYIAFGQQAGAIPAGATKASHKAERALFKATLLAVGYGMAAESLAQRIGQTPAHADALLDLHKMLYSTYWRWIERCVIKTMVGNEISTVLGWQYRVGRTAYRDINLRSLTNWPVQSNASDMMRCAAILLTEAGHQVAAPVHDAFCVLLDADRQAEQAADVIRLMRRASAMVLGGYETKVEAEIVQPCQHYSDEDGATFWSQILQLAGPMPKVS